MIGPERNLQTIALMAAEIDRIQNKQGANLMNIKYEYKI